MKKELFNFSSVLLIGMLILVSCGPGKTGGKSPVSGGELPPPIVVVDEGFSYEGNLGLYKESLDNDSPNFNLTCMLGESAEAGKVVLRIRTGLGGTFRMEKVGLAEFDEVYLEANKDILLTSEVGNGTYKLTLDGSSKVKACSLE